MPEVGQLLVDALLLHLNLEDLQRLLQVLLLVHQLVEPSAHKQECGECARAEKSARTIREKIHGSTVLLCLFTLIISKRDK